MYNKFNSKQIKRANIFNYDEQPPEKHLISDGDIFIKQLSEKQRNTNTNLKEQLSQNKEFYKASNFVSVTNYTAGPSSLQEFSQVEKYSDEVEKLTSFGLSATDIELYFDAKVGIEHLKNKHKNIDRIVLDKRLEEIYKIVAQSNEFHNISPNKSLNRQKTETVLSAKPNSLETQLLKFALENQNRNGERLPHPMDDLANIEKKLFTSSSPVNIKKIRRKARSLNTQIQSIAKNPKLPEPTKTKNNTSYSLATSTKWDSKTPESRDIREDRTYSCKPRNYYTIKNGEIIPINSPSDNYPTKKISLEDIRKLPKFQNYTAGVPSKVLFLKNLANSVCEENLRNIFHDHDIVSIRLMNGKMRGQAFIECKSVESAEKMLHYYNGTFLKNKPIIIQFGKSRT